MLSIRSLTSFSLQLGVELSLAMEPPAVEDACYSLFAEFSKVATVSVSKPSCVRVIVYGPNFELRFFARHGAGEALVSINAFCEDSARARQSISMLLDVYRRFFRVCRGYVTSITSSRAFVKVVTTMPKDEVSKSIKVLSEDFGASLRVVEFRDLDDSSIRVFTGFIPVSGGLKGVFSRIVVVERRGLYATLSITLETQVNGDDPRDVEDKVYGLVGLARALMDLVALPH